MFRFVFHAGVGKTLTASEQYLPEYCSSTNIALCCVNIKIRSLFVWEISAQFTFSPEVFAI